MNQICESLSAFSFSLLSHNEFVFKLNTKILTNSRISIFTRLVFISNCRRPPRCWIHRHKVGRDSKVVLGFRSRSRDEYDSWGHRPTELHDKIKINPTAVSLHANKTWLNSFENGASSLLHETKNTSFSQQILHHKFTGWTSAKYFWCLFFFCEFCS